MAACSCKHLWRLGLSALAAGALAGSSAGAALPGQHVDVALVIATDVSYSVDDNEARFQREGAIAAFRNPEVLKAIQAGALGRIAVAYIDFSSYSTNKIIADWHVVHDKASADSFADLPDDVAGDFGRVAARVERAVLSLGGYARVHLYRWGDGGAHFHVWFLPRPLGMVEASGMMLPLWEDVLPNVPDEDLAGAARRVADAM